MSLAARAAAVLALLARRLFGRGRKKQKRTFIKPATPAEQPPAVHHWPATGNCNVAAVGESHYQEPLRLFGGQYRSGSGARHKAYLIPESDNPHDRNAVRVEIGGQVVAYLSRRDAARFRRALVKQGVGSATTSCDAMIIGGYIQASGERAYYGLALDLAPLG